MQHIPIESASGPPPARDAWAALLAAAKRRAHGLHAEVHPQWREACFGKRLALAVHAAPHARLRASALLLQRCGLRWPGLSAFAPLPQRLALLPHPDAIRVLVALALFARPSIVRRCLSRDANDAIRQCVGEPMYDVLQRTERGTALDAGTGPIDPKPELLAEQGWSDLVSGAGPFDRDVAGLVRLNLPPQPERHARPRIGNAAVGPRLCNEFFAHVAQGLPELKWLFGFELDAAKSASITA